MKPTIRSSSLPTLMVCTPAVLNPDKLQVVETENEVALLGTLVHGLCESLVKTGSVDLPSLKSRLSESDYDRAGMLFNNFLTLWAQASKYMTNPQVEEYLESDLGGCKITGHIDCFHRGEGRAFILDYKMGRQHEDHYHQMAAYAYLLWDDGGKLPSYTVYVSTVYLEDNSIHPFTFTADDLAKWAEEVNAKVADTRYTAGRKCAVCTLQDSCPAYKVFASNAIRSFIDLHENEYADLPQWGNLDAEDRGKLVDAMYVVDKSLDRVRLSLRNEVKSKGSVDIGGGKEYALVEQTERLLDVEKAIPILTERIGLGNVHRNARLPLDTVLTAYAARAPRGTKTQARKELLAELEAAGAVQLVKSTKMWRRPKGEQTLEV